MRLCQRIEKTASILALMPTELSWTFRKHIRDLSVSVNACKQRDYSITQEKEIESRRRR